MTYRDDAIAAYQAALAEQEAEQRAKEDDLEARARKAAKPLFTRDGVLLDPLPDTKASSIDLEREVVVFDVLDGSEISFAVAFLSKGTALFLVRWVDGQPEKRARVKTLDEVGAALATEEV